MPEESDFRAELAEVQAELLLPIEKKPIGWTLGIGIVLLVVLAMVSRALGPVPLN